MDKTLAVGVSTLLTTISIKQFNLDNRLYYGVLFTTFDEMLRNFPLGVFKYDYTYIIMVAAFCAILYIFKDTIANYNGACSKITLYDNGDIEKFMFYIDNNRQSFDIPKHIMQTNMFELDIKEKGHNRKQFTKSEYDEKVKFNDKSFDTHGFYQWKLKSIQKTVIEKGVRNDLDVPQDYLEISLTKKSCDAGKYMTHVREYYSKHSNKVNIYHVKTFSDGNVSTLMYSGDEIPLETLENTFIEPFFHKQKKSMWTKIKMVQHDKKKIYELGQYPQLGFILYGPPGTGKSSFGHRIARALNRHIFSINLTDYITNKKGLFELIKTPNVGQQLVGRVKAGEVVFILDEIDAAIRQIIQNSENKKSIVNRKESLLESIILEKYYDEKSAKKPEDDKDTKKVNPFSKINNDLTIEDLQELFQGPVPIEGAILIATTNKFEEIQTVCPALFRPGRLTPVKFDYADNWTLNKITEHYYKKRTTIDITDKQISSCILIDFVMQTKFNKKRNEFDNFERLLRDRVNSI